MLTGLGVLSQVTLSVSESEGCSPLPVIISVTDPDPNTITSFQWTITYPDNSVSTSNSSEYIDIFSAPGGYSVSLTINGNETVTEEDFIIVHTPPVAGLTVDDPEGCAPHCVQFSDATQALDGEIIEWSWDFGNGTTSTEQNPSYCYQNAGNYSPVFSVEDEFGCFSSISVPQLVFVSDEYPEAAFTPSSFSDCNAPVGIDFTNNSIGNDLSCAWDFDDGFTQSTVSVTDVSHTFNDVGIYDVCLSVEDNIGCVTQACEQIEIVSAPTPSFNVSDNIVCAGATITFEDTSTPVPTSWSWDFDGDGIEDATGPNAIYEYPAAGNYNAVLTAQYSDQCVGQADMNVEVLQAINMDFTADDASSCATPFIVNFTNNSTGQNITDVEWLIDGVSAGFGDDLQYTFNDFGNYEVGLVVTTSSCTDSLLIPNYVIAQPPVINFQTPDVICTGEPVILTNVEIESVDDVLDILWDFDEDGVIDASGEAPNYAYTEPGEYVVEIFMTTVSGCTSTIQADQSILVQPNVVSQFTADNPISCAGEPITFCTSMEESTIYAWNFGDNTGWQNTGFPDSCIVHDYADTGYFDVTLSVYNLACNALLNLEDYIYIPPPIAEFDFAQDCADLLSVTFEDLSIEADSLIWDFGDGSPLVYNDTNPTHSYATTGTYAVILQAFNYETGCFDDYSANVSTLVEDVALTATATTGCAPVEPNFATSDFNQYVEFEVDFGNGTSMVATLNDQNIWDVYYTTPDGVEYDDYSFNANFFPDVIYNDGGLYDVVITGTDESGCSYTTEYPEMVEVFNDLTFADFEPVILEGCDSVLISFEPEGNFLATYEWQFSDGTTSNELNPVHQFFPPWDTAFAATFTATDDFGCNSTATEILDLIAPPIPNFSIDVNPSCIGDTIALTNSSEGDIVSYLWDFGDPLSPNNNSTEPSPEHVYDNNGDYTICLTAENSQGCQQTVCQENAVSIVSPVAEFTFDDQINNCLFGVQFQNTTPGNQICSQWNFGDDQLGSGPDPFHTYPIGVYDVELVVCNEFGCYDTTIVEDIFNFANIIGPYSVTLDDVSCAPFQTTFEAYNTADQAFTYFWEFDDGFGDPNNNTITSHTYTEPGEYCPSLIMEDTNGCPFLITCEEPFVVEEFTFDISVVEPICFGDSTTVAFDGATSYDVSHPELFNAIEPDSFFIAAPQTTDIIVTGYFEDCQYEVPFELLVNPLPTVSLDLADEICFNEPEVFLDGGLPQGPTGIYTVDGVETPVFDPSQPADTDYEVVYGYTDEQGCFNSDTVDVFIHPLPVVALEPIPALCEEDAALTLEGGTPLGGTYFEDEQPLVAFDPAWSDGYGDYEITYQFTDANGCTDEASQMLTVNAQPIASFVAPDVCWEEELFVSNNSTIPEGSIDQVEWDFGTLGTATNTNNPQVPADLPGTVEITLTVTSAEGCVADSTGTFDVFATPVAEASIEDVCLGQPLVLEDLSTTNGQAITQWTWLVDGEEYSGFQQPSDLTPSEWGAPEITLIVATDEGCSDTTLYTPNVFPLPEIEVELEDICAGETAFIQNLSSIPSTSIDEFAWTAGLDGDTLYTNDLSQLYDVAGTYPITLTATSSEGCTTSDAFDLIVFPNPIVSFSQSESAVCAFAEVDLVDETFLPDGTIASWSWYVNGELIGQSPEVSYFTDIPGDYDISLVVATNDGCIGENTQDAALEIWPAPTADFNYSPNDPDTSTPIIYVTDQSEGAEYYEYNISDGAFFTDPDFQYTFNGPGIYDVQQFVMNSFGCTDSITFTIDVEPTLIIYVPNAFTPDGDGVNEIFKPVVSGSVITRYHFMIFNRWGDIVFETTDTEDGWIGNVPNGNHYVQDGVYNWRLEVVSSESGEQEVHTGHVTILR